MKIICNEFNCQRISPFKDKDNKYFCLYELDFYDFNTTYSLDYQKNEEDIIKKIMEDNSNKLAVLNINHENPDIRFIVKYKLNMCFQPSNRSI